MNELQLIRMAWRNLWRHTRRSVLTLSSIAFGLLLATMMTAMQDRSFSDFIDTAARLGSGHVTVQNSEFADAPSLARTVSPTDALRKMALDSEYVERAVDRISGQAMVSTPQDSYGAFFIAYDPEMETDETFDFGDITEGSMIERADQHGMVLGVTLAKNLGARIGSRVIYTLTDRNGEILTGMQRVSGIIRSGSPFLDAGVCLLPIDTVRRNLGYAPVESTQVAIFLDDSRRSLDVAQALAGKLGDSDTTALTWDQIQPEIRGFIAMKVGGARFMEIVIGLLVAAGIFNTMFMAVMERSREFGVMMAIGWSPRQLFRMVMWEALNLALIGLAVGAAITFPLYYWLAASGIDLTQFYASQPGAQIDIGGVGFDPILRVGIFPENAVIIAVAVVVATLTAGIYPAWKAGRVDPVESINLV